MNTAELEEFWSELQEEAASSKVQVSRVYRALGETALGVRASFVLEGSGDEP